MENKKKHIDYAKLLSTPREMCKECYEWLTQEDVGEHDTPHCTRSGDYECGDYLTYFRDDCPYQLIQ